MEKHGCVFLLPYLILRHLNNKNFFQKEYERECAFRFAICDPMTEKDLSSYLIALFIVNLIVLAIVSSRERKRRNFNASFFQRKFTLDDHFELKLYQI